VIRFNLNRNVVMAFCYSIPNINDNVQHFY